MIFLFRQSLATCSILLFAEVVASCSSHGGSASCTLPKRSYVSSTGTTTSCNQATSIAYCQPQATPNTYSAQQQYAYTSQPQFAYTALSQHAYIPQPQYAYTSQPHYAYTSQPHYAYTSQPQYAYASQPQYASTSQPQYGYIAQPQYAYTARQGTYSCVPQTQAQACNQPYYQYQAIQGESAFSRLGNYRNRAIDIHKLPRKDPVPQTKETTRSGIQEKVSELGDSSREGEVQRRRLKYLEEAQSRYRSGTKYDDEKPRRRLRNATGSNVAKTITKCVPCEPDTDLMSVTVEVMAMSDPVDQGARIATDPQHKHSKSCCQH